MLRLLLLQGFVGLEFDKMNVLVDGIDWGGPRPPLLRLLLLQGQCCFVFH